MEYPLKSKQRYDAASVPALAKIARPSLTSVYSRVRLFRQLDQARKYPVIWVSAPAGAGKTTLLASYLRVRRLSSVWYQMDAGDNDVASFFYYMGRAVQAAAPKHRQPLPLLTREYLIGLPTFTGNYFQEFYERLKRPSVVVFDNYQDVDADGPIQHVLRSAIAHAPAGISLVVISRQECPEVFTPFSDQGRITSLGWDDLKLTDKESHAIVRLRQKHQRLPQEAIERLHRGTQGWVAGLVLLTEQSDPLLKPSSADVLATQPIFDYFADEVFRRSGTNVQSFLLKTALLSKISAAVAAELTGENTSTTILNDLSRRNYFTIKHADGTFEYHPLFRAFLVNRADETLSVAQINSLRRRSAELLAKNGDVETAIVLLQQAQDWPAAMRLILDHANDLIEQGRTQTLSIWLEQLPPAIKTQNPWALYWLGACRLDSAPVEARGYFERAFALFEKQTDATPLYLVWAGIIDSYIYEFNDFTQIQRWLDLYPSLREGREPPSRQVETKSIFSYIAGLRYARPDHPEFLIYVSRAERLFQDESNIDCRFAYATILCVCHLWFGDIARAAALLNGLRADACSPGLKPLTRLYWHLCVAIHSGGTGDSRAALRAYTEGLALAQASGIHTLDVQFFSYGIYGQLYAGNTAAARELLQNMSQVVSRRGRSAEMFYRHAAAMVYLHEGDVTRAVAEAELCVALSRTLDVPTGTMSALVNLTYAHINRGDIDSASRTITEARALAQRMRSKLFTSFCLFAEANIHRCSGNREQCLNALRDALGLAQEMGHVTSGACPRDHARELYAIALEADIYPEYARKVIVMTRLEAPFNSLPENWPWQIRLYTLGRFTVLKDDSPLVFSGRTQKKPLDLLRMLIVFGGRNVSVAKLIQVLWPDADGDMARTAFRTTLHRLRRLLGEKSILMTESQLSLNPRTCWLDTWFLERCTDDFEMTTSAAVQTRRLLNVYRGAFLERDNSSPIVIERERLRAKFLQAVGRVGQALENESDIPSAVALYERGLETEPLAEDLYRRLMQCHVRAGRIEEAIAVYRRCEAELLSVLKVRPGNEIRAVYDRIKNTRPPDKLAI